MTGTASPAAPATELRKNIAAGSREQIEAEARAPHSFARVGVERLPKVRPCGIGIDGPAQTELEIHGSRDTHELGELVVSDDAAEVVRAFDVDVERHVDRCAYRGDLREREIRRDVDRVRAQTGDNPRRRRVRDGQHHRYLRLHVGELPGADHVDIDNRRGGLEATNYLLAQGHRRIATITGPLDWPSARERLDGYRDALRAKATAEAQVVEPSLDWGLDSGRRAAERLLAVTPRPTAIFAQSDLLALGAIAALRAHGLRVPDDVSIIGRRHSGGGGLREGRC